MSRLNPWTAAADSMKAFLAYSMAEAGNGIEASLQHLVKIRSSQINGCAICLHMHAEEALKDGETQERIWLLDAWHEAGVYTARERAALAWTDALTRLSETRAPDAAYEAARAAFSEEELVKLTVLINIINSWNRFGVGFRQAPMGLKPVAEAA